MVPPLRQGRSGERGGLVPPMGELSINLVETAAEKTRPYVDSHAYQGSSHTFARSRTAQAKKFCLPIYQLPRYCAHPSTHHHHSPPTTHSPPQNAHTKLYTATPIFLRHISSFIACLHRIGLSGGAVLARLLARAINSFTISGADGPPR